MFKEFKARGPNGKLLTKSLFKELSDFPNEAPYTLAREHRDIPGSVSSEGTTLKQRSIYKAYMELEDLTEMDVANKYFEGWNHWCRVSEAPGIKEHVAKWREELEIKLMSRGLKFLKNVILDEDSKLSDKMFAAKYYANREYAKGLTKAVPSPKRPKKEELVAKLVDLDLDNDFERLVTPDGQAKPN
jgi:hypothetical protein